MKFISSHATMPTPAKTSSTGMTAKTKMPATANRTNTIAIRVSQVELLKRRSFQLSVWNVIR